jgi:hypothetical protein
MQMQMEGGLLFRGPLCISLADKTKHLSIIFCQEVFAALIIKIYFVTDFPCVFAYFFDNTNITDLFPVLSAFTHKMPLS